MSTWLPYCGRATDHACTTSQIAHLFVTIAILIVVIAFVLLVIVGSFLRLGAK